MKHILSGLTLLFAITTGYSQNGSKQNEIKLNIANTIAIASVEFGYERFIDDQQSLEAKVLINDRMNYHSEKGSRKFDTNSFKLGYNYYFGDENGGSGLYINPFVKYRSGEFREDGQDVEEPVIVGATVTNMDSFIIGLGSGYKWNFNDTFVLGPFINVGRNFSEEVKERFSAIEINAGFNIGYRF